MASFVLFDLCVKCFKSKQESKAKVNFLETEFLEVNQKFVKNTIFFRKKKWSHGLNLMFNEINVNFWGQKFVGSVISSEHILGFTKAKTASPRQTLGKVWQAHGFNKAKKIFIEANPHQVFSMPLGLPRQRALRQGKPSRLFTFRPLG